MGHDDSGEEKRKGSRADRLAVRCIAAGIEPEARHVLLSMLDHERMEGRAVWPSIPLLMAKTGLWRKRIRAALAALAAAGIIAKLSDDEKTASGIAGESDAWWIVETAGDPEPSAVLHAKAEDMRLRDRGPQTRRVGQATHVSGSGDPPSVGQLTPLILHSEEQINTHSEVLARPPASAPAREVAKPTRGPVSTDDADIGAAALVSLQTFARGLVLDTKSPSTLRALGRFVGAHGLSAADVREMGRVIGSDCSGEIFPRAMGREPRPLSFFLAEDSRRLRAARRIASLPDKERTAAVCAPVAAGGAR